jgi:iron-sulfur cluster assembly accessory protein
MNTEIITLTAEAKDKLFDVIDVNKEQRLRIAIQGGGCAGFEYQFDLANPQDIEPDDLLQENFIVIDPVSAGYLQGAILDYVSEFMSARFVLKNPNAKSTCGCGHSFNA